MAVSMTRRAGWLVLLALPWLGLGCGGPANSAAAATPASTAAVEPVWHPLGTWSGRGSRQTGSFDVTTGTLRVRWEARGEGAPGAGRLRVTLHSAISGRALQTIVDARGSGADQAYVQDDPRTSYLEVEADGVDWRISVDEAGPARRGGNKP